MARLARASSPSRILGALPWARALALSAFSSCFFKTVLLGKRAGRVPKRKDAQEERSLLHVRHLQPIYVL